MVGRDAPEVLGERAIGGDVPDCEETRIGRGAFDRGDQLVVVLAKNNMARGARRSVRRRRLIEFEGPLRVRDFGQTSLFVDAEAAIGMGRSIRRAPRHKVPK